MVHWQSYCITLGVQLRNSCSCADQSRDKIFTPEGLNSQMSSKRLAHQTLHVLLDALCECTKNEISNVTAPLLLLHPWDNTTT